MWRGATKLGERGGVNAPPQSNKGTSSPVSKLRSQFQCPVSAGLPPYIRRRGGLIRKTFFIHYVITRDLCALYVGFIIKRSACFVISDL